MTTKDHLGNTVRGFEVIIARPGKINLRYPAKNSPLLTGKESINLMQAFARHGLQTIARTESWGQIEEFTMEEMEEIVI